jgi:hypothetical protein
VDDKPSASLSPITDSQELSTSQSLLDLLKPNSVHLTVGIALAIVAIIIGVIVGRNLAQSRGVVIFTPSAPSAFSLTPQPQTPDLTQTSLRREQTLNAHAIQELQTIEVIRTRSAKTDQAAQTQSPHFGTEDPTETQTGLRNCVVVVETGDSFGGIFGQFDLVFQIEGEYYKYLSCEKVGEGVTCLDRSMLEWIQSGGAWVAVLYPGDWLEIPERQTRENCLENNG